MTNPNPDFLYLNDGKWRGATEGRSIIPVQDNRMLLPRKAEGSITLVKGDKKEEVQIVFSYFMTGCQYDQDIIDRIKQSVRAFWAECMYCTNFSSDELEAREQVSSKAQECTAMLEGSFEIDVTAMQPVIKKTVLRTVHKD